MKREQVIQILKDSGVDTDSMDETKLDGLIEKFQKGSQDIVAKQVSKEVEKMSSKKLAELFEEFGVSDKEELKSKLEKQADDKNINKGEDVSEMIKKAVEEATKPLKDELEATKTKDAKNSLMNKLFEAGIDKKHKNKIERLVSLDEANADDFIEKFVEEYPEYTTDFTTGKTPGVKNKPNGGDNSDDEVIKLMQEKAEKRK